MISNAILKELLQKYFVHDFTHSLNLVSEVHRMLSKSISEPVRSETEKDLDAVIGIETVREAVEKEAKNKTSMWLTIQEGGIRWANAPVMCRIH